MRVRVAKKIGHFYRYLFSTAALRACRRAANRREVVSVVILKPLHFAVGTTSSCRARGLAGAGVLIIRALSSSFPCRRQPVSPTLIEALPGLEYLKKTFSTDIPDKSTAVKPSCPRTKKRVEWLNMSGLERPRKAFSLARDDLEAAIAS